MGRQGVGATRTEERETLPALCLRPAGACVWPLGDRDGRPPIWASGSGPGRAFCSTQEGDVGSGPDPVRGRTRWTRSEEGSSLARVGQSFPRVPLTPPPMGVRGPLRRPRSLSRAVSLPRCPALSGAHWEEPGLPGERGWQKAISHCRLQLCTAVNWLIRCQHLHF